MATADLFDTRTMLAVLEQMKPPKSFLLDTFFSTVEQSTTRYIDIDIIKGKRRMAPFVSPRHEGQMVERLGYTTRSYQAPYVKPKMQFSAEDLLKKQPGDTIYSGGMTPIQLASQVMGRDLAELQQQIARRMEWMAASALNGGVIAVEGEGVSDSIDFGMLTSHKITSGITLWGTSASAVPLTNLRTWRRLVAQDSGLVPDVCVMAHDVADAFIATQQVKDYGVLNLMPVGVNVNFGNDIQASGAEQIGSLFGGGLRLYVYNEWYVDDNGVEQPMVPAKKLFLGSTRARAARHYGLIQDLEAGDAAVPYFPKSWVVKDPSVRWLMVQSAPLVVPHQIDGFLVATALA
jgi:hypothetical protein